MDNIKINNQNIVYKIFGTGNKTVVIDTAIGTCSAEWWHLAIEISSFCKVLVYDRAGYGKSEKSKNERTPQNIAIEINSLLENIGINENVILLGHSQGGFYVLQYALIFPSKINGIILLDPATPYDNIFEERLTKDEYKNSGVNKTLGLKFGLCITSLKLGFLVKPDFTITSIIPYIYFLIF